MKIQTTIYVVPTPKGRPKSRIAHKGGKSFVHVYTPGKTQDAEAMIKAMIRTQVMKLGKFGPGVPIRMEATFYLERPKSLPKKVLMPVKRPDADNFYKLLTDSLERFIYPADSQITTALIKKRYSGSGELPRIELLVIEDI